MKNPTVYVPQRAMRRMPDQSLAPVHDLSPCERYGELCLVFDQQSLFPRASEATVHAFETLRDFSDEDSIVATGDPAAIALVAMVAGIINNGRVALLRWDRWSRSYQRIVVDLSIERNVHGNLER